jgi:hypothetical protein
MIFYTYDALGNYTGAQEHVKYQPIPLRYTEIKPPVGNYPVWTGKEWELRSHPVLPPEPAPPSKEQQQEARANAYRDEADPLFFKYQRGEGSEQEWLDKIEEIRQRFPYPTEL